MKKKLLSLLLCISVVMSPIYGLADSGSEAKVPIDNFRDIEWGTPLKEVEDSVITKDMVEEDDYAFRESSNGDYNLMMLNSSVSSYKASVTYVFQDDKLVRGIYNLNESHTNSNEYYNDYCNLVSLYIDKYGEPFSSDEDWSNDLYKGDADHIGTALAMGYVSINSYWIDDAGNDLMVMIFGDNYEIYTSVIYNSNDYVFSSNTDGI